MSGSGGRSGCGAWECVGGTDLGVVGMVGFGGRVGCGAWECVGRIESGVGLVKAGGITLVGAGSVLGPAYLPGCSTQEVVWEGQVEGHWTVGQR